MSEPVCSNCGQAASTVPCPVCGSEVQSALQSDSGITPPLPGVPALPHQRPSDGKRVVSCHVLPLLPGYEVLELIEKTDRLERYKARQTGLRRMVLVTLLKDFVDGVEAKNSFRHEAQTLARLGHPNLVQIIDVGECQSGFYFATEFCSGPNLDQRNETHPLSARQAAELVEQIARGVQAAHERGIVHGRITAGAVLFSDEGTPKLAEFGHYRLFDEAMPGLGEDIRDLGRLLKACCRTTLPVALQNVCDRCEKGIYGSARELADELGWFLAGETVPAVPGERLPFLTRELRRLCPPLVIGTLVLLAIQLSLAGLYRTAQQGSLPIDLSRAEIWVGAPGANLGDGPKLPSDRRQSLQVVPEVNVVDDCLCGRAVWRTRQGQVVSCLVLGGDHDGPALGPVGMLAPRLREQLRARGSVILCRSDQPRLNVADPPSEEEYELGDETIRLVALVNHPSTPVGPLVFCSTETARRILGISRNQASYLLANCRDSAQVPPTVQALRDQNEDLWVFDRQQLSQRLRLRWLTGQPLAWTWAALSLLALAGAGTVIAHGLRRRSGLPNIPFAATVAALAAVLSIVMTRSFIWAVWPSCADLLRSSLLELTALCGALLLFAVSLLLHGRPRGFWR